METHGSVSMVVRYLFAVSLAISLTACTGNESPRETAKLSTEAKIDSFALRYK